MLNNFDEQQDEIKLAESTFTNIVLCKSIEITTNKAPIKQVLLNLIVYSTLIFSTNLIPNVTIHDFLNDYPIVNAILITGYILYTIHLLYPFLKKVIFVNSISQYVSLGKNPLVYTFSKAKQFREKAAAMLSAIVISTALIFFLFNTITIVVIPSLILWFLFIDYLLRYTMYADKLMAYKSMLLDRISHLVK